MGELYTCKDVAISIHALREEGDGAPQALPLLLDNFNPRPPRGGRPRLSLLTVTGQGFQSTPSARRATGRIDAQASDIEISIHALREESDRSSRRAGVGHRNFNPRPPRGERRVLPLLCMLHKIFQSTPSARRATIRHEDAKEVGKISIHALREEGDKGSRPPEV